MYDMYYWLMQKAVVLSDSAKNLAVYGREDVNNTWFNGVGVDKISKEFDTSKIYAYDESVYTYDDFVNNFIFGTHRLDGTKIVKEPKEFDGLGL